MAYLIDRIKESLAKEGLNTRSNQARAWLRAKINNLRPSRQALLADRKRLKDNTIIGRMYFYYYDPKTKDKLQYYDRFPLVLPIERYQDGFLGLNMHYIHPKQRIFLLDALSDYATNTRFDKTTKLKLSYDLLSRTSLAYQPCVKRYLFSHVQSRFLEIDANEWDIAALLPVEQFQKSSSSKVWADSRKKY